MPITTKIDEIRREINDLSKRIKIKAHELEMMMKQLEQLFANEKEERRKKEEAAGEKEIVDETLKKEGPDRDVDSD